VNSDRAIYWVFVAYATFRSGRILFWAGAVIAFRSGLWDGRGLSEQVNATLGEGGTFSLIMLAAFSVTTITDFILLLRRDKRLLYTQCAMLALAILFFVVTTTWTFFDTRQIFVGVLLTLLTLTATLHLRGRGVLR
jgi:hypothetical protein